MASAVTKARQGAAAEGDADLTAARAEGKAAPEVGTVGRIDFNFRCCGSSRCRARRGGGFSDESSRGCSRRSARGRGLALVEVVAAAKEEADLAQAEAVAAATESGQASLDIAIL